MLRADAIIALSQAYVASTKGKSSSEYTFEQRAARKEIAERKKSSAYSKCGKLGHQEKEYQAIDEQQRKHQETKRKATNDRSSSSITSGNFKAFMAYSTEDQDHSLFWCMDSSCTKQMAADWRFFATCFDLSTPCSVEGIGGVQLQAVARGDIHIKIQQQNVILKPLSKQ